MSIRSYFHDESFQVKKSLKGSKSPRTQASSSNSSPSLAPQPVIATGVLRYAIPAPRREGLDDRPDRGMSFMDILRTEPPEEVATSSVYTFLTILFSFLDVTR